MSIKELQKQTNKNVREKANLIWDIATHLYGEYKPHEYGRVILPMTVIKRFDDSLKETKAAVLAMVKTLDERKVEGSARDAVLKSTAKCDFYNTSKFDFHSLLADSENISANFTAYLQGFSDNVKDIIARFEFDKEISKMTENDLLFTIISEFNSKKADMSPKTMTSQDMGYIFEELIRKFSESYDEQAGAHFTSRDIIYLMTELLVSPEREEIKANGCNKTAYDMAMGTSQMLACLDEKLKDINEKSHLMCFGQEFNPETYAIAKSDMLIKGGNAENMKFGDTLSNDQFEETTFDYIISNPPFGIDWKKEQEAVEKEAKLGFSGRFGPGLPAVSDGQMLFMLNGIKKLKDTGRMAIIQNGSALFNGDAGSGPSEIRRYLIENDYLEAIIKLPQDLFYNTGITTYIWLVTKSKIDKRKGKIQIIDASYCYTKRRKVLAKKRVDLLDENIAMIVDAYNNFATNNYTVDEAFVSSIVLDNDAFGYYKVTVEQGVTDNNGHFILKKGKKQPIKNTSFTDVVWFKDSKDDYMNNDILPYIPNAYLNKEKEKIGYEISFDKYFKDYVEPRKSSDIYDEIVQLEDADKNFKPIIAQKNDKSFIDTGISYCKSIPENWKLIANRNLFISNVKKVGENFSNYQLLSLTTTGVKEKDLNATGGKVPESYNTYQVVNKGQMVFCLFDLDCSAVFSGISNYDGMITSAYDVFDINKNNADPHYLDYWFNYVFSNRYYKTYSKNVRFTITGDIFGAIKTPIPPLEEQRKISNILDTKCSEIDELINNKLEQIEKLKEYKKSLVYEYVTGKNKI